MRFSGRLHASQTLGKHGNFIKYILQTFNFKGIFGRACPIPLIITSAEQYNILDRGAKQGGWGVATPPWILEGGGLNTCQPPPPDFEKIFFNGGGGGLAPLN